MHEFLINNRDELIERCKAKVARRPRRAATPEQLKNGVPLFLEQLTKTLQAENEGHLGDSLRISGASGGEASAVSEIGISATAHGRQLLELGYTLDQVVHDYGDLCQAITDLAVERDAPFSVDEFRTLNRCLDNAIADAVTEFSAQRDLTMARQFSAQARERLGFLVHELRNSLHTASLALTALETGQLPIAGATGAVLKRSLAALTLLVERSLEEIREPTEPPTDRQVFSLAAFVADASNAAMLQAEALGCSLTVRNVEPGIEIEGHREPLLGALVNLLQNAFKFTRPHTEVSLHAHAGEDGMVSIDVEDHCGGLPPGAVETMFRPHIQRHQDKSGLGLGLTIAQANVQADGGTLSVRDVPGRGCVFTIRLPRHGDRRTKARGPGEALR
ncbi:HAMP domain-containing histidine kinase [Ramlibacter ginsenosidimutans]|uniref:histidine kinase n=1 Tax=Ramlibacter ginsenosidimutans TaxID=502333 RepID=A0A934TSU3_9BURK|nr:HAMP domain-containing sensor histidine kinase [Ramlibacter ginsenosidimutans]MBK6006897.1 HAMP domain-containing histidine kinase [Ramlibacter ginsenosidimutans]